MLLNEIEVAQPHGAPPDHPVVFPAPSGAAGVVGTAQNAIDPDTHFDDLGELVEPNGGGERCGPVDLNCDLDGHAIVDLDGLNGHVIVDLDGPNAPDDAHVGPDN